LRKRFGASREFSKARILLHAIFGTQFLLGFGAYWSRLSTADAKASVTPAGAKEPIFADSGTYQFQLSEVAQLSLACRVQFTGGPD